jgi:hypothetical protein
MKCSEPACSSPEGRAAQHAARAAVAQARQAAAHARVAAQHLLHGGDGRGGAVLRARAGSALRGHRAHFLTGTSWQSASANAASASVDR